MAIKPFIATLATLTMLPAGATLAGAFPNPPVMGKGTITEDRQSGFDNRPREIFHEICKPDMKPHNPLTESEGECRDWASYVERVSLNDTTVEYAFKPVNDRDVPTRQSARRFYEWNPPSGEGNGAMIAAHIHQDIETFRYASPKHRAAFRGYCPGTEPNCDNAPVVYLANEDSWVDAFGAAYGANASFHGNRAPGELLLTNGKTLSAEVRDALERLKAIHGKAGRVHLVGGSKVLNPKIEEELRKLGWTTTRSGGATRVETIANMRPTGANPIVGNVNFVTLVRGFAHPGESETAAYADAVNTRFDYSHVYVTNSDHLPDAIKADMQRASQEGQLFGWARAHGLRVYGGKKAVSDAVVQQFSQIPTQGTDARGNKGPIGIKGVARISGPTRYDTAARTVRDQMPESPRWAKALVLVDGDSEGLYKTAFVSRAISNVAYTQGNTIPGPTADLLRDFGRPDRDLTPSPEHRMVFCYASSQACAAARQILYSNP